MSDPWPERSTLISNSMTDFTDINDGVYLTTQCLFLTQRPFPADDGVISRVTTEVSEGQRYQLVVPSSVSFVPGSLRTGRWYEVDRLLYARPPSALPQTGQDCPNCGQGLRSRGHIDRFPSVLRVLHRLSNPVPGVLIVTDETTFNRTDQPDVTAWQVTGHTSVDLESDAKCIICGAER